MSFLINPYAFLAAGGDFESIATVTVGSGGAANIEFTSIPGTYQHLQVRYLAQDARTSNAETQARITFNSDSGSNYAIHALLGNGSSAFATGSTSQTYALSYAGRGGAGYYMGAGVVDILDYADTSKNTTLRSFTGVDNNGSGAVGITSSLWLNTNAITAIKVTPVTANWAQHSTFALYGIKAP